MQENKMKTEKVFMTLWLPTILVLAFLVGFPLVTINIQTAWEKTGNVYAANVTDQNPMILDTAGVISTTPLYVTSAIWHQCVTDGQEVDLRDEASGKKIGYAVCVEGMSVKIWDNKKEATKIYLEQIDSGEIFLECLPSVPFGHNDPVVP